VNTILLALLLSASLSLCAADGLASPEPKHCEKVTLADGRVLVGVVDESSTHIALCDEKTGKAIATLTIDAKTIVAREAFTIVPPAAGTAPEAIPGADGRWISSYTQALASAQKTQRPVLALFTGSDWCPWCKKLQGEVFSTKEFKAWSAQHVILVIFDFPRTVPLPPATAQQNTAVASHYGVNGYPSVLALDGKGNQLGQRSGYFEGGPQKWIPDFELRFAAKR
jgi:protein disulfide-isomerase